MITVRSIWNGSACGNVLALMVGSSEAALPGGLATQPRPAAGLFQLGGQLEPPQGIVPHAPQHRTHRPECLATRTSKAKAARCPGVHQSRVLQRPELQRHRAERDVVERLVNGAGRTLLVPYQSKDLLAPGRRNGVDDGRL